MTSYTELALVPFYLSEAISYLTFLGVAYFALRIVRAYERRSLDPDQLRALARRIEYLETTVETVADQVRRTAEAQRFTTTLLAGRSALSREDTSRVTMETQR